MGVAAAIGGAAVLGAGAGIYSAEKQASAAKKGRKAAGKISRASQLQQNVISEKVGAEAEIARDQLRSSETARGLVLSQMGAPGTYGSSAGQGEFTVDVGGPRGLEGMRSAFGSQPGGLYGDREISGVAAGGKYKAKKGKMTGEFSVSGTVDDPFETATNITNQAQFSAVSSLVGQAIELGNREGELWDALNNSAIGGVMQGAARQQRAAMEEIARGVARGGGARRAGFAAAQKMYAQERINTQLTEGLWKARVNLETTRNQIIQGNLSFANSWVDNQAGIRDTYTSALTNLRTFWSSITPALLGANTAAAGQSQAANAQATDALMSAQAQKGQVISGLVESLSGALIMGAAGGGSSAGISGSPSGNVMMTGPGGGAQSLPGGGAIALSTP